MKSTQLGQHFLVNQAIAEKIVKSFLPVKGPILEIGPGKGILTELLVKHYPGNKITAVELDHTLADELKTRFHDGVELINRDILHIDLYQLFPNEKERVNVIGNVPYYISKDLVDWVLAQRGKITKGMFMMQKEFVEKLMARGGAKKTNARAHLFNGLFQGEKVCDVRPGSFSPPPKVKSTILLFQRRFDLLSEDIDVDKFYLFVRGCFKNRRKTLFNNLAASYETGILKKTFNRLQLNPKARAEQLSLEVFMQIYREYRDKTFPGP